jgi:universal stress protein A
MLPFRSVLAAVDMSDQARHVMYHAAGLAGASGARLTVLHVSDSPERHVELHRALFETVPYGATYLTEAEVIVEPGNRLDTIWRVANERGADLIVCGARDRSGLARLLLGSTGGGLLTRTDRPMFMVSRSDREVVSLGIDRVSLHFGTVLAAVDLSEPTSPQLTAASEMASQAHQNLIVMTVADDRLDDHAASKELRSRAHGLKPLPPHAIIVRHGEVATEIARCALAEGAGLVVMGLGTGGARSRPGAIAIEVLHSGRAHVLAVPEA